MCTSLTSLFVQILKSLICISDTFISDCILLSYVDRKELMKSILLMFYLTLVSSSILVYVLWLVYLLLHNYGRYTISMHVAISVSDRHVIEDCIWTCMFVLHSQIQSFNGKVRQEAYACFFAFFYDTKALLVQD